MEEIRLGAVELKFAELVWANAPIPSGELVKLCKQALGWSKSTTYTVLRKLCERGLFVNENGAVRVLIDRSGYFTQKSEAVVETDFGGSLPAFIAAFTAGKFRRGVHDIVGLSCALEALKDTQRYKERTAQNWVSRQHCHNAKANEQICEQQRGKTRLVC